MDVRCICTHPCHMLLSHSGTDNKLQCWHLPVQGEYQEAYDLLDSYADKSTHHFQRHAVCGFLRHAQVTEVHTPQCKSVPAKCSIELCMRTNARFLHLPGVEAFCKAAACQLDVPQVFIQKLTMSHMLCCQVISNI